jgi:hypothetical protein
MHKPILMNIENNDLSYHFHWSSKIFTNLKNPNTHVTLSSLKITKKTKIKLPNPALFVDNNIFSSHLDTSLLNTLLVLLLHYYCFDCFGFPLVCLVFTFA